MEEASIVAFRKHTLLPLDDCLYALTATIPHLLRISLHRCLQRDRISRLPEVTGDKEPKKKFKAYGRWLKILRGHTPFEYICKCWTNEPERLGLNPHHQMPGPNT